METHEEGVARRRREQNEMADKAKQDAKRDDATVAQIAEADRAASATADQAKAEETLRSGRLHVQQAAAALAEEIEAERAEAARVAAAAPAKVDRSGYAKLAAIAVELRAKADEIAAIVARASDVIHDIDRDGEMPPNRRVETTRLDPAIRR